MMRAASFMLILAACAGPVAAPAPVTWEQDLRPLVEARCQTCHSGEGIGPFPLTTYEQVKVMQGAVRAAVEARRMPPFLAAKGCTEYANDISLSDEQIAL